MQLEEIGNVELYKLILICQEDWTLLMLIKMELKKFLLCLHRALFGSLERFIGILIENYAGKFPFLDITFTDNVVIPISEEFNDYAAEVSKKIKQV